MVSLDTLLLCPSYPHPRCWQCSIKPSFLWWVRREAGKRSQINTVASGSGLARAAWGSNIFVTHSNVLFVFFLLRLGHIRPKVALQVGDVAYHPRRNWIPSCTVKCWLFWLSFKSVLSGSFGGNSWDSKSAFLFLWLWWCLEAFYIPCVSDCWIICFPALCFLLFLKQGLGETNISTENKYLFFISTSILINCAYNLFITA